MVLQKFRSDWVAFRRRVPRELHEYVETAPQQGWKWRPGGQNAVALWPPTGGLPVWVHSMPSDRRDKTAVRPHLKGNWSPVTVAKSRRLNGIGLTRIRRRREI